MVMHIPPAASPRPRVPYWLVDRQQGDEEYDSGERSSEWWWQSERMEEEGVGGRGWLEEYAKWHVETLGSEEGRRNAKYLVARHFPTSGLGNMMQSLVSSFLLAVVTRRIFVHDSLLVAHLLRFPRLGGGVGTNYSLVYEEFGGGHVAVNSHFIVYRGEEWLLCSDCGEALEAQFVFIESDQYFGGVIRNNHHYSLTLQGLFGGGGESGLYGDLASFLIVPSQRVAEQIVGFRDGFLKGGGGAVGMHIRTHTLGHPGYVEPYAMQDPNGYFLNSYWKCAFYAASDLVSKGVGTDGSVVVYLATDNHAVRREAESVLGGQVVTYGEGISREDVDGHEHAFIEMLILAECDEIVSTQMSTYSYVAHALRGKPPWVVNFMGACFKDVSSQPCLHSWRYLAVSASCTGGGLPLDSSIETRNCGYYTQQALTAPKDCTWLPHI